MTEKARKLGYEPACPEMYFKDNRAASDECPFEVETYPGLTKREIFARAALSGLANKEYTPAFIAKLSVEYADALLEELSK